MTKWKQRELEFRAYVPKNHWWNKNLNPEKVIGDYYCLEEHENSVVIEYLGFVPSKEHGFFIVQYTGVKDINGKKIFEGDICYFESTSSYADSVIGFVMHRKGQFCFKIPAKKWQVPYRFIDGWRNIKNLGNVFQNPELVEKYRLEIE